MSVVDQSELPDWIPKADRALKVAMGHAKLVTFATAENHLEETKRLEAAYDQGRKERPTFTYPSAADTKPLRDALEELALELETRGPLGSLYAARARELVLELSLVTLVGTPDFHRATRARYGVRDDCDGQADELARQWLAESPPPPPKPQDMVLSDDETDPRSLLCRVRHAIGADKAPIRVVTSLSMASLAAVGEGVVVIARGRCISDAASARTAMHELKGHVAPWLRARSAPIGLFLIGTARGVDDQEGYALWLERSSGFLVGARKQELALRHVTARGVAGGACFVDSMEALLSYGAPVPLAIRVATRAHRGGGLAREQVYLPGLLRVTALFKREPAAQRVIASGRISADAVDVLNSIPTLRDWAAGTTPPEQDAARYFVRRGYREQPPK